MVLLGCPLVTAAPVRATVSDAELAALTELIDRGDVCILTGAGCSTESGIPDYRGPETRKRARNPIRMDAFLRHPETRQRYWARSYLGFPRMQQARPNGAHRALAQLERDGWTTGLITQNVDSLHAAAGSHEVVELHGALRDVICLDCGARLARASLQQRMQHDNAASEAAGVQRLAPDGDADVDEAWTARFVAPSCTACGDGVLKPDVVFFGESVPKPRVERAMAMLQAARSLLVVGSSLAVFSGYRFVRRAEALGIPVAIVNLGETRGDAAAQIRIEAQASEVLSALVTQLTR